MIKYAILLLTMILVHTSIFASTLGKLEEAQGDYVIDAAANESDYFCGYLEGLTLTTEDNRVILTVKYHGSNGVTSQFKEVFDEVNTGMYSKREYVNGTTRIRNVFNNSELKIQETSLSLFGIIYGPFKDNRIVLQMVNQNTIIYNYNIYGNTPCTFVLK